MIKSCLMLASLAGIALSAPLCAQTQSRTKTYEGPNVSAAQTTTVNPETGTATRERTLTNLNTGNSASSSAIRQRTENGSTIGVVQNGPQGNLRSLEGERTRSENGSTFTGTATGRGGEVYGIAGSRNRDGQGNSHASQSVTNSAGELLGSRERRTTRAEGQVSHSVTRSRAEGVSRPQRPRRPRG